MTKKAAVELLSALAQDSRLGIFRLLAGAGPEGLAVGTIGRRLRLPSTTLSFHLKALSTARLLRAHKRGRFIYYAADIHHFNELIEYLHPTEGAITPPRLPLERHTEPGAPTAAQDSP